MSLLEKLKAQSAEKAPQTETETVVVTSYKPFIQEGKPAQWLMRTKDSGDLFVLQSLVNNMPNSLGSGLSAKIELKEKNDRVFVDSFIWEDTDPEKERKIAFAASKGAVMTF